MQGVIESITALTKDYRNLTVEWLQGYIIERVNQALLTQYGPDKYSKADLQIIL